MSINFFNILIQIFYGGRRPRERSRKGYEVHILNRSI